MSKRARGEGTISQRKGDKMWVGRITIGFTRDGVQIRKTVTSRSQGECKKKLDALKLQLATDTYVEPTKLKYSEHLKTWIEQKQKLEKLKASTLHTYQTHIDNHIDKHLGNKPIQKITTPMINAFYAELAGKMAAKTVHRIHAIISNSLKFAVRDGLITRNPAENALLPKVVNKPQRTLKPEQIADLIAAAREYQQQPNTKTKNVLPLIALGLVTGLRRSELAGLEWTAVDLNANEITIRQSVMEIRGVCHIDDPKTEASKRTIAISEGMKQILEGHRKYATGKFVFPTSNDADKPMSPRNINRFFYAVAAKAGLNINFHGMRHTHITQLIENNINLKTIQDRAGHSAIATTMGYCHPSKTIDRQAAAIFEQYI